MASRAASAPVVYVDSCVYLDLITKNETVQEETEQPRWAIAKQLFEAIEREQITLAASALIEAEVLAHGQVRDADERVRKGIRAWFDAPTTRWADVDRFMAREAAALAAICAPMRADRNKTFGGADATHLAAALRLRSDYLFTQDKGFPLGKRVQPLQQTKLGASTANTKPVSVSRPRIVWAAVPTT